MSKKFELIEVAPVCENCKMIDWTDKNKNGYLCKLKGKRMHPTSLYFLGSCNFHNVKHDTLLRLLWKIKYLLCKIKKPFSIFSILYKKISSLYSNAWLNLEKRICKKKEKNFSPGFPSSCFSCSFINWNNGNRFGFLCSVWNTRSHQKTYMNTHSCKYLNAKHLWLHKLGIKLKKKKKTVFQSNFKETLALTKKIGEMNARSIEDYKNNPDPVQYFSKEHLDAWKKKRW